VLPPSIQQNMFLSTRNLHVVNAYAGTWSLKTSTDRVHCGVSGRTRGSAADVAYLTLWRMTSAGALLRSSDASLRAIAEEAVYRPSPASNRAFKRHYGSTTGNYRCQCTPTPVRPTAPADVEPRGPGCRGGRSTRGRRSRRGVRKHG
jgi:AraC-like DNA-binding protein